MATQTTIIAGVFEQEAQAQRALTALKQAGFDYDQVGVATQGQKGVDLKNDLLGLAMSRESATYYAQEFQAGRSVVSVRPDDREQEAHDILHQYAGYDYEHQTPETQAAAGYMRDAAAYTVQTTAADEVQDEFHQPRSLRLREEQLNVTKQQVQTGEVELRINVVTEQKTITVPVTHEEVVIERHAVTEGQVDTTPISQDETITIPVSEEQVNLTKNTVVTGEVAIGKRAIQETQQVTDTVRHEEVRVEREGNGNVQDPEGTNRSR